MGNVLAWIAKNGALLVGVLESAAKLVAGIISLTPTKKDDKFLEKVDEKASEAKKVLYDISDTLKGT